MEQRLRAYQEVVRADLTQASAMPDIIQALLDHLGLEIVREQTPDYTCFEIREKQ